MSSTHRFAVLIAAGMLFSIVPVTPASADTADDIDDLAQDAFEVLRDVDDDSLSSSEMEDVSDDLQEIYSDAVDAVEDELSSSLSSSECNDIENAVDSFIADLDSIVLSLGSYPSGSSADDVYEEMRDELNDLEDDLESAFDDLDCSGSISSTADIDDVITLIEDYIDDEIDALETEDAPDVGSSTTRFNDWEDEIKDILGDIKDDVRDIESATAAKKTELNTVIDDLQDAVDNALAALEEGISSSREDDYEDLEDDVDKLMDDITTSAANISTSSTSSSSASTVQTTGSCLDVDSILDDLADLESRADDLFDDADGTNSSSEYDDFADEMKDIANDLLDIAESLSGNRVATIDLTQIADAIQDVEDALDSAWDELLDEGTGYSTAEFSDDTDDIEKILDDVDDEFNDYVDSAGSCAIQAVSQTPTTTPAPTTTRRFNDVSTNHEFYIYIEALAAANVLNGYPDSTYKPKNVITRAEFLKIALNAASINTASFAAQSTSYTDVPAGHSLGQYIKYSEANNILPPRTSTRFEPETPITRADAVMVIMKVYNASLTPVSASRFSDVNDTTHAQYIDNAYQRGIISGYAPALFGPNLSINRGEAAKIITRSIEVFALF